MNTFNVIVQLVTMLATLATACFAWLALRSWEHQIIQQADLEIARRLRLTTRKVRAEIQHCRYGISKDNYKELISRLFGIAREMEDAVMEAISVNMPVRDRANDFYTCVSTYKLNITRLFGETTWTNEELIAMHKIAYGDEDDDFGKRVAKAADALDALTIQYVRR